MDVSAQVFIFTITLVYVLIFTILVFIEQFGIFTNFTKLIARAYRGFNTATLKGVFIGLLWAAFDGFITASIIFFIINLIS